jgi:hypothetical protein
MSNNIIPFRPAATGLQEEYQTALFSDDEYIKLNLPRLTFLSDKSCEGTTRWCNKAIICVATVYNWIAKGSVPAPIKIGGIVRFKNSDLLAMEEAL